MVLGGVLAALLAVSTYFIGKFLVSTRRERVSLAALSAGGTCVSTSGFLVNPALGYFAIGALSVVFAILLGYEAGE
jgi:hypothetical protein